jgi:hypothetical protein
MNIPISDFPMALMRMRSSFLTVLLLGLLGMMGGLSVHAQDTMPSQRIGWIPTSPLSSEVQRSVQTAVHGEDGRGKDGPMAKVGAELAVLYYQHQAEGRAGIRGLEEARTRPMLRKNQEREPADAGIALPLSDNGQFVRVEAIASDGPTSLLRDLRGLGLEAGTLAGNMVSGRLPISAIREAATLGSLRGMLPSYARTRVGRVESEADTSHGTVQVREATGLNGSGQKICALSDSYDALGQASQDIQSGDLPGAGNPIGNTTPIDVVQAGPANGSDEGRAMLQLIHDIAPGAELGFHTAFAGLAGFAQGIRDLADAGCTVIVDDVGYNVEPFYQDGPVSNAVDDVVNNSGVPYFSSAGNDGQNSYEAPFRSSGEPGVIDSRSVAHDFDPSSATDTRQQITLEAGGNFRIFSFQWTDPSAIVSGSAGADTDIDVALVDQAGTVVASSSENNIENGVPVESLEYTNENETAQTLNLVIEKAAGPDPEEVKYVYSGSGYTIEEFDTLGPTVYGHPMAEGAMAVAAAPFFNTAAYNPNVSSATLESFSSKGGIPLLFDQDGQRLATPVVRQKPEVTGTDGIDNTFFGTDIADTALDGLDSDPHPNFFGTSAAAPNVAAIAALIRQSRPGLLPTEVYDRLESTAADVTSRQRRDGEFVSIPNGEGVDFWSGYGFVQGQEAIPEPTVSDLQASDVDRENGTITLSWSVSAGVNIQSYAVEQRYFDGPFRTVSQPQAPPVSIENLGLGAYAFRVRWTRDDGTQGTTALLADTLGIQRFRNEIVDTDRQNRRTVTLSWSVPPATENVTYKVQRQAGGEGPYREIGTTEQTSFTVQRQVPGVYNYRVISEDGEGNRLTSTPTRRDIDFQNAAFTVGPYPNPARNTAALDLTVKSTQRVTVEVFNSLGQRVYVGERQLDARTPTTLSLDVRSWSSGVYFLRLDGKEFSATEQMVVVQ